MLLRHYNPMTIQGMVINAAKYRIHVSRELQTDLNSITLLIP